jgi:SAM-dependent methyltransferase
MTAVGASRPRTSSAAAGNAMPRSRILLLRAYQLVSGVSFEPQRVLAKWRELPAYVRNLSEYRRRQTETRPTFKLQLRYLYPALGDREAGAGEARGHYFHQDLYIARAIHAAQPRRHVDVGSSVAGFVAHLLTFREVEYVDIRPLASDVSGLHYTRGDMMHLPFRDAELESISALHSPEHVGLGRYGDPVDPDAWRVVINELQRVVRAGGTVYYSVPVGPERVEFDAHRVFRPATILDAFSQMQLADFAFVDDAGDMHRDADPDTIASWYGCGIFTFQKH